jgi:hypothetical protein
MKKDTSTSPRKVRVLNKNGSLVGYIERHKALFSVKSDKSAWVDADTIQVLYHHDDLMEFKREVWKRDCYVCYLCGKQMYNGHPELTVDHIYPRRLGGSVLPKNMACCCKECNKRKGHRTLNEYILHLYAGLYFMITWLTRSDAVTRVELKGGLSGGNCSKEKEEEKVHDNACGRETEKEKT